MINLLQSSPDILRLITSSAASVDVMASWVDCSTANPPVVASPGRTLTAIASATTTTIVATPSSGYIRNVKTLHIFNKDASLPVKVTVVYDFNSAASTYRLWETTLLAGQALEYIEGIGFFTLADQSSSALLIKCLTADDTGGQNVATAQPWFPTTGAVAVAGSTTYRMRGLLSLTHGATTHTTGLSFGGTASLTSIRYLARTVRAAANTLASTFAGIDIIVATNTVVDVTGTQAATVVEIDGIVRINAAGTLIPQYQFSANPTGTITTKKDSFFELRAIGDNTLASLGTWS